MIPWYCPQGRALLCVKPIIVVSVYYMETKYMLDLRFKYKANRCAYDQAYFFNCLDYISQPHFGFGNSKKKQKKQTQMVAKCRIIP